MPASPTKRALLIGINAYERVTELEGCTNDVQVMDDLLRGKFGFTEIATLTDAQATRAGMLAAFDALAASTQPGDIVALYYAGHGSRIRDREGDKPSGWDTTLVPVDGTAHDGSGDGSTDVTDDDVQALLAKLSTKTEHITLIVDACHSGNITREVGSPLQGRTRGVPDDPRTVEQLGGRTAQAGATRAAGASPGPSGWLPIGTRYVLIAGCRPDELSGELTIPFDTPVKHGALTYYLSQALNELSGPVTYRDLHELTAARVVAFREGKQHPQIEGAVNRKLFGTEDVVPMKYVVVSARVEGASEVTLAAGAALGMTPGSRFMVHAPGTSTTEGATPIGELEITSVGPFKSQARIVNETAPEAVTGGARAVITRFAAGDQRLAVSFVTAAGAASTALAAALAASPLVRVVADGETWAVKVQLVPARAGATPSDVATELGALAVPTWVVTATDGLVSMPPKPEGEWTLVAQNVANRARFRIAMELHNPDPASTLTGKVKMELLRATSDTTWEVATPQPEDGGHVVIDDRDFVGLRLTNGHDADVYVNVLDFGAGGKVERLYPTVAGANEKLAPGKTVDLFTKQGGRIRFTLPDIFPYSAAGPGGPRTEGIETFRLFVTSSETSFEFLENDGMRGAGSPLQLLFQTALARPATREPERETPLADLGDWTTVDRSFVIRRRRKGELAGAPAVLTGATITVHGTTGTAQVTPGAASSLGSASPLLGAFDAHGITVARTIALSNLSGAQGATPGSATVSLELPAPPRDMLQIVVTTDERGLVSWHLPQAESATRDTSATPSPTQRFVLPVRPGEASEAGTRGVTATGALIKMASVLLAPFTDPILGATAAYLAHQWETVKRPYAVRPVRAASPTAIRDAEMTTDDWARMGQGRALLLLHAPLARAAGTFSMLPPAVMETLDAAYGGRVFAFDHHTLSADPLENAKEFARRLPTGVTLDLDVLAMSRGGLVARALAERSAELALGDRALAVRRVVMMGTPNAGSRLVDPARLGVLVDVLSTAVCCVPGLPPTEILDGVITTVKSLAVGSAKGLDGLMAMKAGSDFLKALNAGPRSASPDTRYFAVDSAFNPDKGALLSLVAEKSLDAIFGEANDLLVPAAGTSGSNGSAMFPVTDTLRLEGTQGVPHLEYLSAPAAHAQLVQWLTA